MRVHNEKYVKYSLKLLKELLKILTVIFLRDGVMNLFRPFCIFSSFYVNMQVFLRV